MIGLRNLPYISLIFLANGFLGYVAEQLLGAFVPTRDQAVQIFADDGIT